MFNSEKGYGTAEALVAVSAIFMVMGMFIPLILGVMSSLESKENNLAAERILYEHLEEEIFTGQTENSRYLRNGTEYTVIRNEGGICTIYPDFKRVNRSRCLKEDVIE
jgi:hypothetical protein